MLQRFESFVTGITVCYKFIQRIKDMEMTSFGLKGTHLMVLYFLRRHQEGLTASQLCQLCAEDKAAISRTLATLQQEGLILTEGKKYRALLRLSETGEALVCDMEKVMEQWVDRGGEGLTKEERDTFYHALDVISTNLRECVEKSV